MDRTNILEVFDEVSQVLENCKLAIKFNKVNEPCIDEPSVTITVVSEGNINISYYLSAEESQEITKDTLESHLNLLIKQEQYRRKLVFRATVSETNVVLY